MSASESQPVERIAVVGLGYVGLPLAVALSKAGFDVVGYDIRSARIEELRQGVDRTGELEPTDLADNAIRFSSDEGVLSDCTFFIVAAPTPIDESKKPDLEPLLSATRVVGRHLSKGAMVVFESTVYPGVTEDLCRSTLASVSGLAAGSDFKVGYSPERVNPGDRNHDLRSIVKVVSAEDAEALDRVAAVYERIITAGLHRAASIRVAEAAKVIENTQRDLNIALMNELAIIFDRMGIATRDVLEAAGTKWNFLKFTPGLVGGHCIGVDPYYLTTKAEQLGYRPEVILAGRRINDNMGHYIAQRLVKALLSKQQRLDRVKVAILGFTFKENVSDIRNTRVIDIVHELREYGVSCCVCDPVADPEEVRHEYGIELTPIERVSTVQALVLAVPHKSLVVSAREMSHTKLTPDGIFFDVKSALDAGAFRADQKYLAL